MGKIVIFTFETDFPANRVILWLHAKGQSSILRFGRADFEQLSLTVKLNDQKFQLQGEEEISAVWFRKDFGFSTSPDFEPHLLHFLQGEFKQLKFSLFDLMPKLAPKVLGTNKFDFYDVNKLRVLSLAMEVGLNIPETIITTQKKELLSFTEKVGKIIAKPMKEATFLHSADALSSYTMYTRIVEEDILSDISETFFPSTFQAYIEKNYELRIFFIEEEYYAAAILSQSIEQTTQDFRNYSTSTPNRIIPYSLEDAVQEKLKRLMNILGLNTGSIDMIVSQDGEIYFLEVNPVGQYEMISFPCNYYLEERIANFLA